MKNVLKAFGIIAFVAVIGFSVAACGGDDSGGGKDEEPVLTMTFTEDPYWNETGHDERYRWLYRYKDASNPFDLSGMYANNKAYSFIYSFISNIDIDEFAINFQDKDGKGISDWTGLKGDIKKNTKYSGSAVIPPNSDAVGTSSADNFLVFYVKNRDVTTPSTMTFYKFSLELVDNENGSGGGGDNDTFNSLDDFKNWLNGKGNNSASSPYNVKLNLPNLSGLADFLKGLLGKFVKLDFSGSTFTSIGADAFKGLTNLTGITLPSGITSIGANAFDGCTNLTDITLPSGVTSIGANAFSGCTNLNSVTFNGTITSGNFSSTTPFPGDLRDKYLAGGSGTYTRTSGGTTWTKQGGGGGQNDPGDLAGTWTGNIGSYNATITVSGSGWTMTASGTSFNDSGSFVRNGNTATLYLSSGTSNGTATLINSTTIQVVLNSNTIFPGTYTLTKQSGSGGGGGSWTVVTVNDIGTNPLWGIAYGNSKYVVVGSEGKAAYSSDGITWQAVVDSKITSIINGITWGNDKFVVVSNNGQIVYSSDGITWQKVSDSKFGYTTIRNIAWGNSKFVAVGSDGKIAYSSDGITWQAVADSKFGTTDIYGVAWCNNKFIAVGNEGKMSYSTDGITWQAVANSTFTDIIRDVAYGNNKFVAVGGVGKIAYSSDGITWQQADTNSLVLYGLRGVAWGNNKFVLVGIYNSIATSPDGVTWTKVTDNSFDGIAYDALGYDIVWGNNKFVISGSGSKIAYWDGN